MIASGMKESCQKRYLVGGFTKFLSAIDHDVYI